MVNERRRLHLELKARQAPRHSPAFNTLMGYVSERDGAHLRKLRNSLESEDGPSADSTTDKENAETIKRQYAGLKAAERTAFLKALNENRTSLTNLIGPEKVHDKRSSFAHYLEGEDKDITGYRYILEDLNFLARLLEPDKPTG